MKYQITPLALPLDVMLGATFGAPTMKLAAANIHEQNSNSVKTHHNFAKLHQYVSLPKTFTPLIIRG